MRLTPAVSCLMRWLTGISQLIVEPDRHTSSHIMQGVHEYRPKRAGPINGGTQVITSSLVARRSAGQKRPHSHAFFHLQRFL